MESNAFAATMLSDSVVTATEDDEVEDTMAGVYVAWSEYIAHTILEESSD